MIKLHKKNLVNKKKCQPIIDESNKNKENKHSKCEEISNIFITPGSNEIEFCAKLNVPLIPKKKQIVLGTTKYLLPYIILNKYFITFAAAPNDWTLKRNYNLIECICEKYYGTNIILRIVTTPTDLVNSENNYRITGHELCLIKYKYNYNFYKLESNEFNNIYFCSDKQLKDCKEIIVNEKGTMYCNNKKISNLYL